MQYIPNKPKPHPLSKARIRNSNYFRYFSPKYGDFLECESELEYRHMLWRESDPNILAVSTQPLIISDRINGKKLNTILDAWTLDKSGQEVYWEVKHSSRLINQSNGDQIPVKWPLIKAWAANVPIMVDFLTEKEIDKHQIQIANCERWLAYMGPAGPNPDDQLQLKIRNYINDSDSKVSLGILIKKFCSYFAESIVAETMRNYQLGAFMSDLDSSSFGQSTIFWVENNES